MWSIHLWSFDAAEFDEKSENVVGYNVGAEIPNGVDVKTNDLRVEVAEFSGYDFGRLGFGFGRPIIALFLVSSRVTANGKIGVL